MPPAAIILSLVALTITVLGLVVKVSMWASETKVYVKELRAERKYVRQIPMLDYRIRTVEKHLEVSAPNMPFSNGEDSHDEEG